MTGKGPRESLTTLISRQAIALRVSELGTEISADLGPLLKPDETLLVVGVLNGAFIFMADLVRAMSVPLEVDFIRLSSYQDEKTSSSEVVMLKSLEREIKGRHVLVVEDIADCGLTLAWLVEHLKARQPASLSLVVAIDKTARRETNLKLDYVGFTIDDGFLVGFGLDAGRRYRELPDINVIKEN
ncbi:MAG: hypoxanthine phosphoribosyltransferase [Deltaproteobacteria bacterium]|jgi:hypoxanthine phosphoribosyltransferase|nr:hypoxanthine phosphoribosyltransferase [Deltaproteobacteria bacterium]